VRGKEEEWEEKSGGEKRGKVDDEHKCGEGERRREGGGRGGQGGGGRKA